MRSLLVCLLLILIPAIGYAVNYPDQGTAFAGCSSSGATASGDSGRKATGNYRCNAMPGRYTCEYEIKPFEREAAYFIVCGNAVGADTDHDYPQANTCANRQYETGWEGGGTAATVNVCDKGCMYESSLDATATSGIGYAPTGATCTTNDAPEPTPATPGGGDDGGGTGGETGGGGDSGSGGDGGGDNGSGGDGGSGGGDGGGDGDGDGNSDGGGDGDGDGDGTGENPSLPENPTYPGDIPMPYADPPIPSSYLGQWSSGLGGGSCPAAKVVTVGLGPVSTSVSFEFKPLCDFALMIKGLVIACAAIAAVYIVAGVRK